MNVPDSYRGRVLSMLFVNRGMIPLGTTCTGLLAETLGAPAALASMSLILMALGFIAIMLKPRNLA